MFPSDRKRKALVDSILKWHPGCTEPPGLIGQFSFRHGSYFVAEPSLWYSLWELIQPRDRYIADGCDASGPKWRPIEIAPTTYLLIGGRGWTPEFIQNDITTSLDSPSIAASTLGKIGGNKMAKRGPEYFKRISAMRKHKRGGRPKKADRATAI